MSTTMTFSQFVATRSDCADFGDYYQDDCMDGMAGYLYGQDGNKLYIEVDEDQHSVTLDGILHTSRDLQTIEALVYAHGILEGYITVGSGDMEGPLNHGH